MGQSLIVVAVVSELGLVGGLRLAQELDEGKLGLVLGDGSESLPGVVLGTSHDLHPAWLFACARTLS